MRRGSVRVRNRVLLLPLGLKCEAWMAHGDVHSHFCRFKIIVCLHLRCMSVFGLLCQTLGDRCALQMLSLKRAVVDEGNLSCQKEKEEEKKRRESFSQAKGVFLT